MFFYSIQFYTGSERAYAYTWSGVIYLEAEIYPTPYEKYHALENMAQRMAERGFVDNHTRLRTRTIEYSIVAFNEIE